MDDYHYNNYIMQSFIMVLQNTRYYPSFIYSLISLRSWSRKLLAVTLATVMIIFAANISVPAYPVPFTLQSLAVLLIGALLGRKLGVCAVLFYLLLGAIGLPVFANGGNFTTLLSPTAGYLFGCVVSVYLAGLATERGYDRQFITGLFAFALAHQAIFVVGVGYLKVYCHLSWIAAIKIGYWPFFGFDILKFTLATVIMFMLWHYRIKKY